MGRPGPEKIPWAPAGGGVRAVAAEEGPGLRSPGRGVLRTRQGQVPAGPEPDLGSPCSKRPGPLKQPEIGRAHV